MSYSTIRLYTINSFSLGALLNIVELYILAYFIAFVNIQTYILLIKKRLVYPLYSI